MGNNRNNKQQSANKGGKKGNNNNSNNKGGAHSNKKNGNNKKGVEPEEEVRSRKQEERMRRMEFRKERNKQKYQNTTKYKHDFEALLEQLKPLGLTITDAKGDGNCLFRSISHQLYKTQEQYARIRSEICNFIISHREDFEPFIEDDVPFDTYMEEMQQDKEWGGHLELQAASLLFEVNINIFQVDNPRWDINNFPLNHKKILLSYHDHSHYASVHFPDHSLISASNNTVQLNQSTNSKNASNQDGKKKENSSSSSSSGADEFTSIEKMIMGSTLIKDIKLIRQSLLDFDNNVELTMQYLFTIRDSEWEANQEVNGVENPISNDVVNIDIDNEDIAYQLQMSEAISDSLASSGAQFPESLESSDHLENEHSLSLQSDNLIQNTPTSIINKSDNNENSDNSNNNNKNDDDNNKGCSNNNNKGSNNNNNKNNNPNNKNNANNNKKGNNKRQHMSNTERKRLQRIEKQQKQKEKSKVVVDEPSSMEEERRRQIEQLYVPQLASLQL